jgi:type I restriction enzyme S subunit
MPKINQGVVLETPIPLPPSEEQQRIVETIDRIVPLCDDLSSLIAESNEHGERLFKAALEDVTGSERDCASIEVAS